MKKFTLKFTSGFLAIIIFSVFTFYNINVYALEESLDIYNQTNHTSTEFDLTKKEKQEITLKHNNSEDIRIAIEPVQTENKSHINPGHSTWKVYIVLATVNLSYMIDVFISHTNYSSQITRVYGPKYFLIGGTMKQHNLKIINKYEGTFSPASAQYYIEVDIVGGFGGFNAKLTSEIKNQKLRVRYS